MNNKQIPLLVDASGNNARLVNPFERSILIEYEPRIWGQNANWNEFEATVKTIPLTTPQTPNSVIKGVEVEQWCNEDADYFIGWQNRPIDNARTRLAYQPLPIEEKEQVKEESVEDAAQNAANDFWNFGYADSDLSTSDVEFDKLDSNIVDTIHIAGFKSGYDHAITSSNLVSLDKVIGVVKNAIKISDKPNGRLPESTAGWNNAIQNILTQLKTLK